MSNRVWKRFPLSWILIGLVCSLGGIDEGKVYAQDGVVSSICRPVLSAILTIELGKSGNFHWSCDEEKAAGSGYYIVFIRPNGTYVLLKVPRGRASFEFAPDTVGMWRWLVINTDPDRSKPDLESDPGNFLVIEAQSSN